MELRPPLQSRGAIELRAVLQSVGISLLLLTIGIWLYGPQNLAEALGSRGGLMR